MKEFVSIFCILFSLNSHGQFNYSLSVENKAGIRLPYSSIYWGKNNGVSSNEYGIVNISLPKQVDTFFVTNVGYKTAFIITSTLQKNTDTFRVVLDEQESTLPALTIFSNEKTIDVGVSETATSFVSNRFRNVLAAVEVEQPSTLCKINSISVFIYKKSQLKVPFRVRVFTKNGVGFPDIDLLRENVICTDYKPNQWNVINLIDYNVIVDSKAFFIAVEWLNLPDINENNDLQIGLSNKDSRKITIFKLGNKPWKKLEFPGYKFDNIMIKATLIK
jgi:hypothetical protein